MNAIVRNLQRRAVVEGLFRRDVWEYPLDALREALVNTLAHHDYSPLVRGTPVQVRIFPDRLEVENPGGLFGPVMVERLGEPGLLATRNAHLMRLLEDLPVEDGRVMCENRGTGITAMLESLRAAGMEPPRFDDRHTTFRLTFTNTSLLDDATLAWLNRFAAYDLNGAQRLALAYAHREGRLTHADYRRLNPSLDSTEVTRHLTDLVQRGLLNQHGTRRWTFYTLMIEPETAAPVSVSEGLETQPAQLSTQLPAQLPAQLPRRLSADLVRAAVLRLCLAQSWSAAELAARLGRNKRHLLQHHLSPLVTEGLLEMVGTAPTDPNLRYRTTDQGRDWLKGRQEQP